MNYNAGLTLVSANEKTGPIPVSTTEAKTCPKTCAQYSTCYAKYGPLEIHWRKINSGERGMPWLEFCAKVAKLPRGQLWRHNQAGDLPGDGKRIDKAALQLLVDANKGKSGFTYTHYPLDGTHNLEAIEAATQQGFAVNIRATL